MNSRLNALDTIFQRHVINTFETYLYGLEDGVVDTRADVDRFGLAAEACLHFAEQVFRDESIDIGFDRNRGSKEYVNHLTSTRRYFAVVRDVANVYKRVGRDS